jgi:hypothetical protein
MIRSRLAALLFALSLPLLLAGCSLRRVHILIPDFVASGVDGIRLFRVLDDGTLERAGRVVFGPLTTTADGLRMEYTQLTPGKEPFGPLQAAAERPASGQLALELSLYNFFESGYFRFASFNEKGVSPVTRSQLFLARSF